MNVRSLVALCCVTFLMVIGLAPAANAASAYDDLVVLPAAAVIGGTTTCSEITDVSTNWYEMINDSTTPFTGGATARSNFLTALDTAISNDFGFSVVQQTTYDANLKYMVEIVVTPSGNAATFSTYTGYPGDHDYLSVNNSMHGNIYIDGYDSCKLKLHFFDGSTSIVLAQHEDLPHCYGGFCDERQPLFVNNGITYPDGYSGVHPSHAYTPPTPVLSHHTGTVDCMDTEPPAQMLVYQTGNNGSATLTVSSLAGKADWAYDFTDGSYRIAVLCGTKWTYSYGMVTEKNANWYCDPNGVYLKECQLG